MKSKQLIAYILFFVCGVCNKASKTCITLSSTWPIFQFLTWIISISTRETDDKGHDNNG